MHGLQEIIYINKVAAQKAKARAHKKRNELAQKVIADRINRTKLTKIAA